MSKTNVSFHNHSQIAIIQLKYNKTNRCSVVKMRSVWIEGKGRSVSIMTIRNSMLSGPMITIRNSMLSGTGEVPLEERLSRISSLPNPLVSDCPEEIHPANPCAEPLRVRVNL